MTKEQKRKELQRHLATSLYMDTPLFSKIECNIRATKHAWVVSITKFLSSAENVFLTLFSDKIIEVME